MKREAKRITPDQLSPEARQRYDEIQRNLDQILEEIVAERPEIEARAREVFARSDAMRQSAKHAIAALRVERQAQGISLDELAQRTRVDVNELQELEDGELHHFDVSLVIRYADALGKQALLHVTSPSHPLST